MAEVTAKLWLKSDEKETKKLEFNPHLVTDNLLNYVRFSKSSK